MLKPLLRYAKPNCLRTGSGRLHVILACSGLALAGFFLVWCLQDQPPQQSPATLLRQAKLSLTAKDFAKAELLASEVPPDHPAWPEAMLLAGEAASRDGRIKEAGEYFCQVPLTADKASVRARFSFAEVLLHTGRITEAESAYREVIRAEQGFIDAYSRIAYILGATGRRRESGPFLFSIIRSGAASLDELILLADIERPVNEEEFLRKSSIHEPVDQYVNLGMASYLALDGRSDDAIQLLRPVVDNNPSLAAAQCLLGELLVEASGTGFEQWHSQLPAQAELWPDLWFVRGRWAEQNEQFEMAARCFMESLKVVPLHRRANYELGIVLARLNIPEAKQFSQRARELLELSTLLTQAKKSEGTNEDAMQKIVKALEGFDRYWEACAWANISSQKFSNSQWPAVTLQNHSPKLSNDLPLVPASQSLGQLVDVSEYAEFKIETDSVNSSVAALDSSRTGINFQQADVDFGFRYLNADDPTTEGARIQEQTGGGVSVIDIDLDTWPDLYLVQGGKWIHGKKNAEAAAEYSDQIFRNQRGVEYRDVTAEVGIQEFGFGQSCAVGDINEDGFPDLYIANVGKNTVYLNNGDGTFHHHLDIQDTYTSSVAIADLNSDGIADLFDVNYVTGPEVYHLICGGRACSPSAFTGVVDQLHVSSGDGTFTTTAASTPESDAKGLGVLVAGMGDELTPSVFVANDQTPNFLLSMTEAGQLENELVDNAFRSGVAYSQDGLVTAAMGIAADDIDNNGLIDFFVTNFQDESNCLYLQTGPGFFSDSIRSAGLRSAGFPMVGWGSQFLDADLDGEMDLVVANGHVESYADEGEEAAMSTQLFRNMGGAEFVALQPEDAGEFFARKYFGRGLAKLDWNQDGLMDFSLSPIKEDLPLVTNTSTNAGHFLNIKLHATGSSRDAICARVEVSTDNRSWKKQLVAGDGFHASNERILQFGIGSAKNIKTVQVTWPSGMQSEIAAPPVNSTLVIVEARPTATVLQSSSTTSAPVMTR